MEICRLLYGPYGDGKISIMPLHLAICFWYRSVQVYIFGGGQFVWALGKSMRCYMGPIGFYKRPINGPILV